VLCSNCHYASDWGYKGDDAGGEDEPAAEPEHKANFGLSGMAAWRGANKVISSSFF
jgi:hypothetical protein